MSVPRPICSPALCATTCCSGFVTFRFVRPTYEGAVAKRRARQLYEAQQSGNIEFDLHADWLDYRAPGWRSDEGLSRRITEVLARLDLEGAVYTLGLRWRWIRSASRGRRSVSRSAPRHSLAGSPRTGLPISSRLTTRNGSTSTPRSRKTCCSARRSARPSISKPSPTTTMCCRSRHKTGLIEDLVAAGRAGRRNHDRVVRRPVAGSRILRAIQLHSAKDLPDFAAILGRIGEGGTAASPSRPREALVAALQAESRHAIGSTFWTIPCSNGSSKPVRYFATNLPPRARQQIEFFDPERYNAAASVQDNILFGKIAYGEADAPVRIPAVLAEVIDALALRPTVVDVGLDYHVGTGGSRLSLAQRQKAAIARAVLKRPDVLILNEATSALDGQEQLRVSSGVDQEFAGRGIIWVLHRASLAKNFDRVLVLSGGQSSRARDVLPNWRGTDR